MTTKETIVTHSSLCTGCRACEVACGFRQTKEMDPSRAFISVQKEESTGLMKISLKENCDVCRDEEVPFCLQVCRPRALSLGRKQVSPIVLSEDDPRRRKGGR